VKDLAYGIGVTAGYSKGLGDVIDGTISSRASPVSTMTLESSYQKVSDIDGRRPELAIRPVLRVPTTMWGGLDGEREPACKFPNRKSSARLWRPHSVVKLARSVERPLGNQPCIGRHSHSADNIDFTEMPTLLGKRAELSSCERPDGAISDASLSDWIQSDIARTVNYVFTFFA